MRHSFGNLVRKAGLAGLVWQIMSLLLQPCASQFGSPPPEPPPLPVGRPAPQFTTRTLDNHFLRLWDLRGKIVVLDFWATWCTPCKQQMPTLDRLQRDYAGKGVRVIGLSLDTTQATLVRPTVHALGIRYTIGLDPKRNIAAGIRYNAGALPCIYVIDQGGILRWDHSGVFVGEDAKIRALLDRLIINRSDQR